MRMGPAASLRTLGSAASFNAPSEAPPGTYDFAAAERHRSSIYVCGCQGYVHDESRRLNLLKPVDEVYAIPCIAPSNLDHSVEVGLSDDSIERRSLRFGCRYRLLDSRIT